MRHALPFAAILACMLAAPVVADDGYVPQTILDQLGLAEMETLSAEDGLRVRGMGHGDKGHGGGGAAAVFGASSVTGLVIDPSTKSYIFGASSDFAAACSETICPPLPPDPYITHASTLDLGLTVVSPAGAFDGVLIGGAGGSALALAQ